jgi:hypothetical protein
VASAAKRGIVTEAQNTRREALAKKSARSLDR